MQLPLSTTPITAIYPVNIIPTHAPQTVAINQQAVGANNVAQPVTGAPPQLLGTADIQPFVHSVVGPSQKMPSSGVAAAEPQHPSRQLESQRLQPGSIGGLKADSTLHSAVSGASQVQLTGSAAAAVALVSAGKQSRARSKSNGYDILLPRYIPLPITLLSH